MEAVRPKQEKVESSEEEEMEQPQQQAENLEPVFIEPLPEIEEPKPE